MNELGINIGEHLRNGIFPDERMPCNARYMETMQNMVPRPVGAVLPETITNATSATITTWPFPQVFAGENITLQADATTMSTVARSGWTVTPVTTYNPESQGSTKAITTGGSWHCATFQDCAFLTNGVCMVFKIPSATSDRWLVADSLTVNTLCRAQDRLILAGLAGSWFSGSRWTKLINTWRATLPGDRFTHEDLALDTRWVVWGEFGGGDDEVPFQLFLAALGVFGNAVFDKWEGKIIQLIESRLIGMAPLRAPGTVLRTLELGNGFAAYGTNSVSYFAPDQANGYAEQTVLETGIKGRSLAYGDDNIHAFLNPQGQLFRWRAGSAPELLGFDATLSAIAAAGIISYDPVLEDFYIADNSTGYILTAEGKLGGPTTTRTTGLIRDAVSGLVGAAVSATQAGLAVILRWHRMDMNTRSTKASTWASVQSQGLTGQALKVEWVRSTADSFVAGPTTPCNLAGAAFVKCSFVEGKLVYTGTVANTTAKVTGAIMRFNLEDRRYDRGTAAEG